MFKKLFVIPVAIITLAISSAYAAVAGLTSAYTVSSTSFVDVPGVTLANVPCTNMSFMGGLYLGWVCPTVLTVKDANLAGLNIRMVFGTTVATAYQETVNPDGSVSRFYLVHNPKGINSYGKIAVKAQAAKVSADVVLDPSAGDVFRIEG